MARTDTWMPLYIGDYLSDTMRLTTVQHGAYMLLLMEYWKSGPLVDDDAELAGITKMDAKSWTKIAASIRRFFTVGDDGRLHQKRVDLERQKAIELSEKRRQAGARKGSKTSATTEPGGSGSETNEAQLQEQEQVQEPLLLEPHAGDAGASCAGGLPSPSPTSLRSVVEPEAAPLASALPPNARDRIWSEGLAITGSLIGKSPNACRGLMGKWLRDLHDDCPRMMLILNQAQEADPIEPLAWINRAVSQRPTATKAKQPNGWDEVFDTIREFNA